MLKLKRFLLFLALLALPFCAQAQNMRPLCLTCSNTSINYSIINAPFYTDALVLSANVSQTQTIPTSATWAVFSSTCNFFAKTGASASVPGSTTTNGTAAMLNPSAWYVVGQTQLTVIANATCTVTVSFYL